MLSRRNLLTASLAATALSGLNAAWAQGVTFDAVAGPVPQGAAPSAKPYPTLTAALAAAPANDTPWRILIGAITLREKVAVTRPRTIIHGLSPQLSRIVWDDYSGRTDPDNPATTLGTRRSGTVTVTAPEIRLQNLSIVNSFDFPGQKALPDTDPKKAHDLQALALAVSGSADRVALENLVLDGWQDTLFIDSGRTLVKDCHILGCIDFIFGAGTVALDHCRVTSRLVPIAIGQAAASQGYVCAPSTLLRTPMGFVFFDCTLDHEGEPFPDASVALARPWRPTTSFADGRYGNPEAVGACLYLRCVFGDHIAANGFDHMGYNARGGVKSFVEPEDARFYVRDCTGRAVATIPARFTAPDAMVAGLTPQMLLGLKDWRT